MRWREDMNAQSLLVGLDLCNDYTQLCVYDSVNGMPSEELRFPTLLSYRKTTNQWNFGDKAMADLEEQDIVLHHFIGKMIEKESIYVLQKEADNQKLLSFYMRKVLGLLKKNHPTDKIKKLVITVPELPKDYEQLLYQVMEDLNIMKDRVTIMAHEQCFLYYAISQDKELWSNDVGLFDFGDQGLHYYQMSCDRRKEPVLVGISHKDFSQELNLNDLTQGHSKEELMYAFDILTQSAIHRQILSSIYITGKGFDGEWANEVMEKLSVGRRIFFGANLYANGACYCARELCEDEEQLPPFVFLDEKRAPYAISTQVYQDGKTQEIMLVRPGIPWDKINETIDLISDGDEELTLTVNDVLHREEHTHIMTLEGMLGRTERMCRLSVQITFSDVNVCVIRVKDKGFGEIFPAANRVWEETIELS